MPVRDKGVLITAGGTTDGSVMRARDVEFELRGCSLDPKVLSILYRLAEINHVNMKAIAELATMQDHMIETMQNLANVATEMKGASDRFNTFLGGADVDGDITTN